MEMRAQAQGRVSLFSGIEFNVDRKAGLDGVCDFLISASGDQVVLEAPVLAVVEAKKDDLTGGIAQCAAEMVAARRFNEKHDRVLPVLYGVVTNGSVWLFARLTGALLEVDLSEYPLRDLDQILGILGFMVTVPENPVA